MSTAMEVSWGEGSRVIAVKTSGLCESAEGIFYMVCVILWDEMEGALCCTHSGSRGCSLVVQ